MPDVKPSAFTNTTPTDKDADFIPYTLDKTGTPLDRTMSLEELWNTLSLLTTITSINSDSADLVLLRQDSDSTSKDITVDNFFKGKQDIGIPAAGLFTQDNSPAADLTGADSTTNDVHVKYFAFDQSTDEFLQCGFPLPGNYGGTTTIEVRFYWKTSVTSGNVVWAAQGLSLGDDEAIDTAFGTAQTVTDGAGSAANDMMISSFTNAITLAGTPTAGEWCQLRFYRDTDNGSDTLAADAELIGVQVRITINKKASA